nr:MAG TPA: hypothetical protein [Caudoviricetes sp.]
MRKPHMSILWRIKCKPSRYCCLLGFFSLV